MAFQFNGYISGKAKPLTATIGHWPTMSFSEALDAAQKLMRDAKRTTEYAADRQSVRSIHEEVIKRGLNASLTKMTEKSKYNWNNLYYTNLDKKWGDVRIDKIDPDDFRDWLEGRLIEMRNTEARNPACTLVQCYNWFHSLQKHARHHHRLKLYFARDAINTKAFKTQERASQRETVVLTERGIKKLYELVDQLVD